MIVLIYLFTWRVMRTAMRDVRRTTDSAISQESTIIPAAEASRARRKAGLPDPRIVVVTSQSLRPGMPFVLEGAGLTIGRSSDNDIVLDDDFVSSHHARVSPPSTLLDLGSTNGTLVNGSRISGRTRLSAGDRIRFGETEFRYEAAP